MPSERTIAILLHVASTLLTCRIVWYARVTHRRLPRQQWWRWIAQGFAIACFASWVALLMLQGLVPRSPWEVVHGTTLVVISVVLLLSIRAAARQAQRSEKTLALLDRTKLRELEAQIGVIDA